MFAIIINYHHLGIHGCMFGCCPSCRDLRCRLVNEGLVGHVWAAEEQGLHLQWTCLGPSSGPEDIGQGQAFAR